jgi:hypothetical protein
LFWIHQLDSEKSVLIDELNNILHQLMTSTNEIDTQLLDLEAKYQSKKIELLDAKMKYLTFIAENLHRLGKFRCTNIKKKNFLSRTSLSW